MHLSYHHPTQSAGCGWVSALHCVLPPAHVSSPHAPDCSTSSRQRRCTMHKLRMRLEDLRVDSFQTAATDVRRGTVRAYSDCTYVDSCFCHTAYAVCGTGPQTIYSCNYTVDEQCDLTTDGCQRTVG